MLKFFDVFKLSLPILAALVPGSGKFLPYIAAGVDEAQKLHGATGDEKAAHAANIAALGAQAAAATGKVAIDPTLAADMTKDVFAVVDQIHAAHKSAAAQPSTPLTPAT